jgi:hypothetical protein
MEAKHEMMWFVWIVVIRDFQDVLAVIDVVDSIGESGIFAAARGCGGVD